MLTRNQADFSYFSHELKDNYQKGVHRLRTILAIPEQAQEFAGNTGAVAVVYGVPEEQEDRNSAELRAVVQGSAVADLAVTTYLRCFFTFADFDALATDADALERIFSIPKLLRAARTSGTLLGKLLAQKAGLPPANYADMKTLFSTEAGAEAVITQEAVYQLVRDIPEAWACFLDTPASAAALVAGWERAYKVWTTPELLREVEAHQATWDALCGVDSVTGGKTVAKLLNQNPDTYADAAAVAANDSMMGYIANTSATYTLARRAALAMDTMVEAMAVSDIALRRLFNFNTAMSKEFAHNKKFRDALDKTAESVIAKALARMNGLNPDDFASANSAFSNSSIMNSIAASDYKLYLVALNEAASKALGYNSTFYNTSGLKNPNQLRALSMSRGFLFYRGNDSAFRELMKKDPDCLYNLARPEIVSILNNQNYISNYYSNSVFCNEFVRYKENLGVMLQKKWVSSNAGGFPLAVVSNREVFEYMLENELDELLSSSNIGIYVSRNPYALHRIIRDETLRVRFAAGLSERGNEILSTTNDTTYFSKSGIVVLSGGMTCRAIGLGITDGVPVPSPCIVCTEEIGQATSSVCSEGSAVVESLDHGGFRWSSYIASGSSRFGFRRIFTGGVRFNSESASNYLHAVYIYANEVQA
ncbi:hypothetical protein [Intestinibacillus massiliensis]